jgi:D-alanyl-D-alanine carboxypeptidase
MSLTQLDQRLKALLDEVSARDDIHACTMSLASGSGAFRWEGARGEVSPGGAAATPDMPWFTASITKLFIAACPDPLRRP